MRRCLRGLVIVLGMLWVAAAADASTILIGDSSIELPSFVGHEVSGIPGGALVRQTEVSTLRNRNWVRAGGNSRFGRRDFIWHPDPFTLPNPFAPPGQNLYDPRGGFPTLPVTRVLFDPLDPFPVFFPTSRPDLLPWRDSAEESWRLLRFLVDALPDRNVPVLPRLNDHLFAFNGGEGGGVISIVGSDEFLLDEPVAGSTSFEGTSSRPNPGATSLVVNAVPEPGSGALLLAGFCALAARRRRC